MQDLHSPASTVDLDALERLPETETRGLKDTFCCTSALLVTTPHTTA